MSVAVERFLDSTLDWLDSRPPTPFTDLLSGAVWLFRRGLFPTGGGAGLKRLHYALFNTAPTLTPTQPVVDPDTGIVTGSLGGYDPDGDAITYTLISPPGEGVVEIASDGTWTYFANAACGCTVDTDSFSVAATDTGPDNPWHLRTALSSLLARLGLSMPTPQRSTATITVTEVPLSCSEGSLCSAPTLSAWARNLPTSPKASLLGYGGSWYELAVMSEDGTEKPFPDGRATLLRASSDAPMELDTWSHTRSDGVKGMIKNYSAQAVLVEMRLPVNAGGESVYEIQRAVLLPGDQLPYTLSKQDFSGDGNQVIYLYALNDQGQKTSGPVRVKIVDPYLGRPYTVFAPANSDWVTTRNGWDVNESHHEIWGGTKLWIKREEGGWLVPNSKEWYAWKDESMGSWYPKLINSFEMQDWAVFSIHIDSL